MTCRCSSSAEHTARALAQDRETTLSRNQYLEDQIKELKAELVGMSAKANTYKIVDIQRVGPHVALKVQYPSCDECAFEGIKVLVYLSVSEIDLLSWRRIDPHFHTGKVLSANAPSPAARFPASEEGWKDAIDYLKGKAE